MGGWTQTVCGRGSAGLIERTCPSPPTLVGHVLGGAIGATVRHKPQRPAHSVGPRRLAGAGSLPPGTRFAATMIAFLMRPTERTYTRFMRQCSYDLDGLREEMGARWEPFLAYGLERARGLGAKLAGRLLREFGMPQLHVDVSTISWVIPRVLRPLGGIGPGRPGQAADVRVGSDALGGEDRSRD